ncbi:hypothetical protein AUJ66_01645 [Candidatus Desantisbacteria bacterium CG1_02_38_46]|nr:MAG: hypothetical protein AUJ66_01645 [Candidatus Desantisbacteria bacterium CG1_02_38_46]
MPVPRGDALVIISPHWEGVRKEFGDAFKNWYKAKYKEEAKVEWLDQGGSSDDLRFVKSEFALTEPTSAKNPNSTGIDIFFGGGVEPHLDLMKNGYTLPYKISDENLKLIPKQISGMPIYDPAYNWYGACLSSFGIVYNKVVLKMMKFPEPKTWEDLANPDLLGWVGSADLRHSGTIHMMYEIILQAYGWQKGFDIITKMAGNIKSFPKHASQTPKDVSNGQVAYGLAIDAYGWAQVAEVGEEKVGFMLPEKLTVINPDAISILKGAPHLDLAKAFLEFVMSIDGQKLWILRKGEPCGPKEFGLDRLSVIPKLYDEFKDKSVIRVNPFKFKGSFKYSPDKGSLRYTILNDFIGALVIDTHKELGSAWKAIIASGMPGRRGDKEKALKKFLELPASEDEILSLAKDKWNDQAFRNNKIKEWIAFARNKYIEAEKLAK